MDASEKFKEMVSQGASAPMEDVEILCWYNDPIYILMCEKAEEIQSLAPEFNPPNSDYFSERQVERANAVIFIGTDYWAAVPFAHYIWLPRQDQLQVLSGLSWYLFDKTCVTWATINSDYQRESKEIVGLRVVMKLNYKKQWVDSDWTLS